MKNYTVLVSRTSKGISGNDSSRPFNELKKAITAFTEECDYHNCDNIEINADGSREAGGIGYDYRIELTID